MNDEQKAAMAKFYAQLDQKGASYIRCENGDVVFAFSKARVQEFLQKMEEGGEEKIVVLIQQGEGGNVLSEVN